MLHTQTVQEIIDILRRDHLPEESTMKQVLSDTEFNRGRVSAIYELVDTLERLIIIEEEDNLVNITTH